MTQEHGIPQILGAKDNAGYEANASADVNAQAVYAEDTEEAGPAQALLLAPPRYKSWHSSRTEHFETDAVAGAINAWLHAKFQRSQSVKTQRAYDAIVRGFRMALVIEGLDLDSADPRRCRRDITDANDVFDATEQTPSGMSVVSAIGDIPSTTTSEDKANQGAATTKTRPEASSGSPVEDLAAARAAAIALVAQTYAAQPAETRYGPRAVAPTTANLRLAAISSFYTYALRQDLLRGVNPVARVERRRVEAYAAAHPLAYEELRAQLADLDLTTDAGLRDYALLLIALSTGRRVAELAGMRQEHLTIRKRTVVIDWPRCKGGKRMRDELPRGDARGAAADALVAWIERLALAQEAARATRTEHAAVLEPEVLAPAFASSGRAPERPVWVSLARNGTAGHPLTARAIAQLCEKRLGTSKVHALRHTFARALEDAGAKVSEIQAALGHADLGTTGRYLARLHQGENRHLARLSALYGLDDLDQRVGKAREDRASTHGTPGDDDNKRDG